MNQTPQETSTTANVEVVVEYPLLPKPREARINFVDTVEQLAEAIKVLAAHSGWFAIDAERASGFKYSQRAYLIQIKRGDSPIYLIDPVAISPVVDTSQFAQLAELLAIDCWILHAATQDLPCLNELGLFPTKLFDTELAGRLAGLPRVGLQAMVERFLEVKLAKEHSAVDWSTRPLASDWLNYAALDVDVLEDLANGIRAELAAQNKIEFAEQEFNNLLHFRPKPQRVEKFRSMSGMHEVKTQRGLAIAQQLWQARENLAMKLDVSPGRLIPDSSIVAVTIEPPQTRSALAETKKFMGRASRTYLDTWWQALAEGLQTKKLPAMKVANTGIPNHRSWPLRFPEADKRLNALKPVMQKLAEANAMPMENLLSPDTMRNLAWLPPEPLSTLEVGNALKLSGARDWQIEICAAEFTQALEAVAAASSEA